MQLNFELDADLVAMADAVADFARAKLAAGIGDTEDFRQRWRLAGAQGLAGLIVAPEHGGGGLDAVAAAALTEALGAGCPDTGFVFSLAAHLYACLPPIMQFGDEAQQQRWLPRLASGEAIAAHAITEPTAGSDALRLRTRADRDGDGYVLNGEKCFITNAPVADVFVVQAATMPGGGYFGLTSFLVPADRCGVHVGRPHDKVGLDGSPNADVIFDGVRVGADERLGPEGAGASVFASSMGWERVCLFAAYLGAMRRVVDDTIRHVREREQFGVPIGANQAVSHRVVDMVLRLDAARLLLYRAAASIAAGRPDETEAALAKLAVSEAAVQVALDAVQLHGALGIVGGPAERLLRDALPARIFSGTSEIQRNNIARSLGLGRRAGPR